MYRQREEEEEEEEIITILVVPQSHFHLAVTNPSQAQFGYVNTFI
jgi:hypothetical protein